MTATAALELVQLTKMFGSVTTVDAINLNFRPALIAACSGHPAAARHPRYE